MTNKATREGAKERAEIIELFRWYAANKDMLPGKMTRAELERAMAVPTTLSILRAIGKPLVAETVEVVYLANPTEQLRKDDIPKRVASVCIAHRVSRAMVYKWLAHARLICRAVIHHRDHGGG